MRTHHILGYNQEADYHTLSKTLEDKDAIAFVTYKDADNYFKKHLKPDALFKIIDNPSGFKIAGYNHKEDVLSSPHMIWSKIENSFKKSYV